VQDRPDHLLSVDRWCPDTYPLFPHSQN
jgi:hypothetical protein